MPRVADLARPTFTAQLALARVHPALVPVHEHGASYVVDASAAATWFVLPAGRGFAGYGLARALRMLLDLLAALTALHETMTESGAGFVHGELAPALVRVDTNGIARLVPLAGWHWQNPNVPISPESLGHWAPERLLGDTMDRRADVYGAGVLLWEALAGKRLFERDSADQIVTRLMGGKVLLPELPPELAWAIPLKAIAMRALSVDPEQRFADCSELAAAIEAVSRRRVASHAVVAAHFVAPARTRSLLPPPMPHIPALDRDFRASHKSSLSALVAPSVPAMPAAELERELPPIPSRRRPGVWMASALVCLLVVLGIAAFTRRDQGLATEHDASSAASVPIAAAALPTAAAAPVVRAATEEPSAVPPPSEPAAVVQEPGTTTESAAPSAAPPNGLKGRVPVPGSKPAVPTKTPRVRDKEAEQYGI